jgi:hypothetical protein
LCAGGERRALATSDDARFYAFLRGSQGGGQALAVFNFQAAPQAVTVDLTGHPIRALENLETGAVATIEDQYLSLDLPAYGYAIYQIQP